MVKLNTTYCHQGVQSVSRKWAALPVSSAAECPVLCVTSETGTCVPATVSQINYRAVRSLLHYWGVMLVGEGQSLDLQEIWLACQTVDVDTEGMCGELGIESGTQPSKRMSMVGLDVQLLR